jgi:hypothetical protein
VGATLAVDVSELPPPDVTLTVTVMVVVAPAAMLAVRAQ